MTSRKLKPRSYSSPIETRRAEVARLVEALRVVENFQRRVLYEDNHLLVLDKPAGIATQGAPANEESLFTLAQRYVKITREKPGAVYLGVVSRLDLPVSGVVVFARTSKAAERLNEQFRNRLTTKRYLALLERALDANEGVLNDFICEPREGGCATILGSLQKGAKEARLAYKTLKRFRERALVEIELMTGRKHQIRAQFAARGCPIVGDGKYGATPRAELGICLHARSLTLIHPTRKEETTFVSNPPDWTAFY